MTDEETPSGPARRRPASRTEAAALASAVRLRIIRLTAKRALTNKEIAGRLGKDPATTLYHVRKLVAAGFLVAQPERSGARGSKEIPYLGTGLSWRLGPGKAGWEDEIGQAVLGRGVRLWDDLRELERYAVTSEVAESGVIHVTFAR